MTKKKIKDKILFILFWGFLVISFVILLAAVQFKANGWQMNWHTLKIIKTGMIILEGQASNAEITLNGKLESTNLPLKLSSLRPGNYEIQITKLNYQKWQKIITVEGEKASIISDIVLFLEKPQEKEISQNYTKDNLLSDYNNQSADLTIQNTEIIYNNHLISRFSQEILGAILYSDQSHIVFQQGDEIRVIELSGNNNTLLIKLSRPDKTIFAVKDNGRTLYYLENAAQGKVVAKTIR